MSRVRISLAEAPALSWANGRGTTRELLRRETPDGRLLVRLSVADVVEPGPFSSFPGFDRVLVAIDGAGFTLSVDSASVPVAPLRPIAFAGEAEVAVSTIQAPSRDFNVMTARAVARAEVQVHDGSFIAPSATFVFVVAGSFACPFDPVPLAAGDLVEVGANTTPAHFAGRGSAIVILVLPN